MADATLISIMPLELPFSTFSKTSRPTLRSFSCSQSASLALHADQYDAQRTVPTAISQRNTSAVSTTGRSGEYCCTETKGRYMNRM
ncbi:Os06g0730950 [Oryza sativa Japonica Group]|uniref:Os06g0730950 protein n=1 Tax=Oryza sativa subsp. japonica TaxID=39947 RepID=A0A0P0X1C8_ORYSJ|nr:hypothetical protein EE612_035005 [Oryza sativa]BAS99651.1 Os06g0730950 [Oryza sativa Japonica Group]